MQHKIIKFVQNILGYFFENYKLEWPLGNRFFAGKFFH